MIRSSSKADNSLGIEDTPVSLLANTLSDPATDEAMVALLSEKLIINICNQKVSYAMVSLSQYVSTDCNKNIIFLQSVFQLEHSKIKLI